VTTSTTYDDRGTAAIAWAQMVMRLAAVGTEADSDSARPVTTPVRR
jgi:hypothetical protein